MLAELIGIRAVVAIDEMEEDPASATSRIAATPAEDPQPHYEKPGRQARACVVADGMNVSDLKDYRPGIRASRRRHLAALRECSVTRTDPQYSRRIEPTWKPNTVCLCHPFGMEITRGRLRRVESAKSFLRRLGFPWCR